MQSCAFTQNPLAHFYMDEILIFNIGLYATTFDAFGFMVKDYDSTGYIFYCYENNIPGLSSKVCMQHVSNLHNL